MEGRAGGLLHEMIHFHLVYSDMFAGDTHGLFSCSAAFSLVWTNFLLNTVDRLPITGMSFGMNSFVLCFIGGHL